MFGYPHSWRHGGILRAEPSSASGRGTAGSLVWPVAFFLFALVALLLAFESAIHFHGSAIDGPFQLYNGLRRIAGGFRPGVDFQYFHGLGIPYAYYGLFRLFGNGLQGSELSRELLTAAVYPVVLYFFFRAFVPDRGRAFCLAATAFALTYALKLTAILFALNGMLGVRSALPTLVPAVAVLAATRRARAWMVGVTMGLALFMSTEQGLAVVAAYVLVSVIAFFKSTERRAQAAESLATLGIAALTLVVMLTIIGGPSGMRGALRYNFRIVPMDQYWYFGTPPNHFIPSWADVVPMLVGAPFIGAAVLLAAIVSILYLVRYWKSTDARAQRRSFALAVLAVYGLVSCSSLLGVFTGAYVQPAWRVLILLGILEASDAADRIFHSAGRSGWLGMPRIVALGAGSITAAVFLLLLVPTAIVPVVPHLVQAHVVERLGFSISDIWPETLREGQRTINAHAGPNGEPPTLWSTYAGWLEARNGMYHPSFDYIIHALGPENRAAYLATFKRTRPTLVQTISPLYTQYEGWLESNSWSFYDELLRWYTITSTTPWSIFWERRESPAPEPVLLGHMQVPAGMTSVQLPPIPDSLASATTVLDVAVEYAMRNPLRGMPIVGGSPRYLIGVSGSLRDVPVSLDPYVTRMTFPLFVAPDRPVTLSFKTFSLLPGASYTPRSLTVWVRRVDSRNQAWVDAVRRRGVA